MWTLYLTQTQSKISTTHLIPKHFGKLFNLKPHSYTIPRISNWTSRYPIHNTFKERRLVDFCLSKFQGSKRARNNQCIVIHSSNTNCFFFMVKSGNVCNAIVHNKRYAEITMVTLSENNSAHIISTRLHKTNELCIYLLFL